MDTINRVDDESRFCALWLRHQKADKPNVCTTVFQQLRDAYNEPQRVYHSLEHIECCLKIFDQVSDLFDNSDAVELAIWFHDVIYELGADDNEQKSADLFMTLTEDLFDDELRQTVYDHIMATCHTSAEITVKDTQLMVDIDLFSFGLPWPDFFRDSQKVREEMSHISDADYYQKQMGFQQALLSRPSFFYSEYFREHYETQARSNLAKLFELSASQASD